LFPNLTRMFAAITDSLTHLFIIPKPLGQIDFDTYWYSIRSEGKFDLLNIAFMIPP